MKSKRKRTPKLAKPRGKPKKPRRGIIAATVPSRGIARMVNGIRDDAPRLRDGQPPPRFHCTAEGGGDVILRCPVKVAESGELRIVGRFWGPDERPPYIGWVYSAVDARQRSIATRFLVTEAELEKWQR